MRARGTHSVVVDAHSRHGYASPRRHPSSYPPSRRAPPDPHTFDYPASLKQYADWFRYYYPAQATEEDNADKAAEQEAGDGSKPRNGIKTRWEKYKKDFAASQVSLLSLFVTLPCHVYVILVSLYDLVLVPCSMAELCSRIVASNHV